MLHRRRFLTNAGLLIAGSMAGVPRAGVAQESTPQTSPNESEVQISLRPTGTLDGTRFEMEIEAGATHEVSATIGSYGVDPIKLRTFAPDVLPVINGGLGVAEVDAERHEPATWMTYQTEEISLTQGQEIERTFSITVPAGTVPGQYVNALVLETADGTAMEGSSSFRLITRKVISVYILVPGGDLVPEFTLGEPEIVLNGTTPILTYPIANTGNVRIDPKGNLTITDAAGTSVADYPVRMGPIYAGQATMGAVATPPGMAAGDYLVTLSLADEEMGVEQAFSDKPVTMPEIESIEQKPVDIQDIVIEANANPIQFANVMATIVVNGTAVPTSRLTMSVVRDGTLVEDFVLVENLPLPIGNTAVSQRYIPLTGWESGSWVFSLKLEQVDTASGSSSVLLALDDVATLEVP